MERILVWVQATLDSLRDFGAQSVHQEVKGLGGDQGHVDLAGERIRV